MRLWTSWKHATPRRERLPDTITQELHKRCNQLLGINPRSFQEPSRLPMAKPWRSQGPRGQVTNNPCCFKVGPIIRGRTYDDEPNVFYPPTDCLEERPIRCQRALDVPLRESTLMLSIQVYLVICNLCHRNVALPHEASPSLGQPPIPPLPLKRRGFPEYFCETGRNHPNMTSVSLGLPMPRAGLEPARELPPNGF
jgi:hypothetical protein